MGFFIGLLLGIPFGNYLVNKNMAYPFTLDTKEWEFRFSFKFLPTIADDIASLLDQNTKGK